MIPTVDCTRDGIGMVCARFFSSDDDRQTPETETADHSGQPENSNVAAHSGSHVAKDVVHNDLA